MREYELKIQHNQTVRAVGWDGRDAARRYVDSHREAIVFATKPVVHGIFVRIPND